MNKHIVDVVGYRIEMFIFLKSIQSSASLINLYIFRTDRYRSDKS